MKHPALPATLINTPIAHRAYHNQAERRPENSRAAMRAAIAAGYGIEMDLQLSSDGVPMVFHDEDLMRLTGQTGLLSARSAVELGQIHLLDGDETIPTFAEILTLVDGQVPLLVELKDQTLTMSETDGLLEAAVAQAISEYQGDIAVMSFNPHSIARMARLAPDLPRGLTTCSYDPGDCAPLDPKTCDHLRDIPDYDRVGASFISHEAADLARPRVAELQKAGAAVLCWTIRSPVQEAMARIIAQNITFEGYPAPFTLA